MIKIIVHCVAQLVCLVLPFFGAPIPSPGASLLPRTCRNGLAKKKWRFSFGWGRESGHKARKDDIFKNIQFGDDIFGLLQFEDDIYKHEMGEFFIVLLNQKNTLSLWWRQNTPCVFFRVCCCVWCFVEFSYFFCLRFDSIMIERG